MTASAQIDTTSLLTILGVIAAIWALISPTSRLRLRFCMTWWDWVISGTVFLLIHYLVFAPALARLGLYYSLGPWKWGLDSSSAVYLLLLSVVVYFFWRMRSPTLVRGRIRIFRELIENLHLTRRYDELVLLVEPQLPKLILLTKQESLIAGWVDRLDPPNIDMDALLRGEAPRARPAWRDRWSTALQSLKSWILARDGKRPANTPPRFFQLAAWYPPVLGGHHFKPLVEDLPCQANAAPIQNPSRPRSSMSVSSLAPRLPVWP
ncbi:hypothetical protein [Pseudomonas aeruginosa]|uniref:hypothetical protein n=1 Tax=Pseudomonas aeruginosa TaxID=287 RepID=UPI000A6824EE|nr:hypothetical protein [Pseudomonas aeruginosa]